MVWANSIMLGVGGVCLLAPIVLHLLMQPRPKELDFPALRFVRASRSTNQRQMRLRHWLLLLLRAGVLLVLALALAGPSTASSRFGSWVTTVLLLLSAVVTGFLLLAAWWTRPAISRSATGNSPGAAARTAAGQDALRARGLNRILIPAMAILFVALLGFGMYSLSRSLRAVDGPILGNQQAPVAAAIVFDNSPRMEYLFENQTSRERGVGVAQWLVEQFPLDSRVAVLTCEPDSPYFSVDLQAAIQQLEIIKANYSARPLPDRIEAAVQLLAGEELERRELYVLTDLTRPSWSGNAAGIQSLIENHPEIAIYVIDVGPPRSSNFALEAVQLGQSSLTEADSIGLQARIRHQQLNQSLANRNGTSDDGAMSASGPPRAPEDQSAAADPQVSTPEPPAATSVTRNIRLRIEATDPSLPIRRGGQTVVPDKYVVEREISQTWPANSAAPIGSKSGSFPKALTTGRWKSSGKTGWSSMTAASLPSRSEPPGRFWWRQGVMLRPSSLPRVWRPVPAIMT